MSTEKAYPTPADKMKARELIAEIRAKCQGAVVWRVENSNGAYCIEFSRDNSLAPEHACREWFARQEREFPGWAAKHGYVIQRSRVFGRHEALALRAAAVLEAAQPSQAQIDILAERQHQVEIGYDSAHDDEHVNDEIAAVAAFYIMPPAVRDWPATETGYGKTFGHAIIPEGWRADGHQTRRRQLVMGVAMGLAEIQRLDRAALRARNGDAA